MRARTAIISTVIAVALLGMAAGPASAVETDPYTPNTPNGPSLVGTSAAGTCIGSVPYIDYSVTLDDPTGEITTTNAWMTISGSGGSIDVPLGNLVDGELSGTVLWPGAAVDGDGNGTAWPGWEYIDGQWINSGANLGWTRGDVTAVIHVNPSIEVPLSYPTADGNCNPGEVLSDSVDNSGADALAATGGAVPYLAMGLGAAAVAAGALLLIRRRATR